MNPGCAGGRGDEQLAPRLCPWLGHHPSLCESCESWRCSHPGGGTGWFGLRLMSVGVLSGLVQGTCSGHQRTENSEVLLSSVSCKPQGMVQGPDGVCRARVEAHLPWQLGFCQGRDPSELGGSGSCGGRGCSLGTHRIPLPGASSGIGLGCD